MISDAQEHCERLRIVVDGDARAKNPDRLSRARGKRDIHHFPARKTGRPGRGRRPPLSFTQSLRIVPRSTARHGGCFQSVRSLCASR